MNTTENNKLLAEFMGLKLTTDGISQLYYTEDGGLKQIPKFNTDWNPLMELVEKCFKTDGDYSLHKEIEDALIFNSENRIQDVYNACVKFVKEYKDFNKKVAEFLKK
jgi:hypothetical protein